MRKQSLAVVALLVVATLLLAACGPLTSLRDIWTQAGRAAGVGAQAQETPAAPAVTAPAVTAVPAPVVGDTGSAGSLLAAFEGTLENIYAQVNPSVVSIDVTQSVSGSDQQGVPGFQFQFPQQNVPQQALGSGFVWDTQGHIVTNYHVVEGATDIQVTFSDGTTAKATLVGSDPDSDLAVIQVNVPADRLHPVSMGDSTQVKVGEIAIAIGNPFGEQGTMTYGIISALGRSLDGQATDGNGGSYIIPDVIQTDAPINPGNSGGVLVDDQGRVIGVTAAIESTTRSNSGIGYAIPSALVQRVVPAIISNGSFEHPWLGISGTTLTPELAQAMNLNADQRGALVISVTPGGPAATAGLQPSNQQATINGQQTEVGGDVIVAIDGNPVKTFEDLPSYLARSQVGQTVTLTVLRNGQQQDVRVTLGSRPTSGSAAAATAVPNATPNAGGATPGRARLGIVGTTLTPDLATAMNLSGNQQGVLIEQVQPNSPADQAGLRGSYKPVTVGGQQFLVGGDVITALNSQAITAMNDLTVALGQAQAGQAITLTILRDGQQQDVQVTLAGQ